MKPTSLPALVKPLLRPLQAVLPGLATNRHTTEKAEMSSTPAPASTTTDDSAYVENDAITHIRIDGKAKTELGRLLCHTEKTPFNHPVFGTFFSMEGFWSYVRSGGDESFRYIFGVMARNKGKEVPPRYIEDFKAIILEANFLKIEQNPELLQLMLESNLPFDMYYTQDYDPTKHGGTGVTTRTIVHPKTAGWMKEQYEEIRQLLQRKERPPVPDYRQVRIRKKETNKTT